MVTAKNLVQNSKTDLGWDTRDADYTTWRNNVKDYCAKNGIVSKTKAGENKWEKCLADAPGLDGFKPQIRKRLAKRSEFHSKALEALIIDTLKKRSETSKKLALKRALKPRARDPVDEEDAEADVMQEDAVAFWIADPLIPGHKNPGGFTWNDKSRRKLAVIHNRTLVGIWDAIQQYIPDGRTVREIQGGMDNPLTLRPWAPADITSLTTDAEVGAFLQMTEAKPILLLIILHRK